MKLQKIMMTLVVAVGAFGVTGCLFVPKAKLDKALAENQTLHQRLSAAEMRANELQVQNDQLNEAAYNAGGIQKEFAVLQSQYGQLRSDYDSLSFQYDALLRDRETAPPPIPLPEDVNRELEALARSHPDVVVYSPKHGMVKLAADLTFGLGSVAVKPEAFDALKRLAAIMDSASASQFNIFVAGHTDNIPISKPETLRRHPNNLYLSLHRAVEVQKILADAGVSPARIAVMGFGEHHPVAPNAGKGGNVANRRVEIWLVAPGKFVTGQ